VDGTALVRDGVVLTLDAGEVRAKAAEAFGPLLSRAGLA
jgi:hypothetical protein